MKQQLGLPLATEKKNGHKDGKYKWKYGYMGVSEVVSQCGVVNDNPGTVERLSRREDPAKIQITSAFPVQE